ncbi:MAG: PEP-CTERM sorting domain-containing protein [Myxococcales bacterium]|nr:PEP-CTERM sorting domain-containing protein [Myxococcales bacterium]
MLATSPARLIVPIVSALAISALLTLMPATAQASSSQAPPGAAVSGCTCHGSDPSAGVGVTIAGDATILPGETKVYTLMIDPGLAGGAFAVQRTSVPGSVAALDVNTTDVVTGEQVSHLGPTANLLSDFMFNFNLTASNTVGDVITLAAAGLQFNDGSGSNGDLWNFATGRSITVIPEPATGLITGLGLVGLGVAGRRRRRA